MAEPVHLENIAAFQTILEDYRVSPHAQKVLDESRLVVLSGLAGGGRNSTINYLVEHYDYFFLISDTTRPPKVRNGVMEQDGVNYYFRREADMLADIERGEFIEAEIIHGQQVSGTSIRELARANAAHKIAIHDFEFGGAHNIAEAKPDAYIIGLLPPSYDEWLQRLQGREDMHPGELINRLRTAEAVLRSMLSRPYFKFVVNTTVPECAEQIRQIVEANHLDAGQQAAARDIAAAILSQVQQRLQPQPSVIQK